MRFRVSSANQRDEGGCPMTRWLILGALLSSAVGCSIPYTTISPTASPSSGPPRKLLTFVRANGYMRSGYELVLFDDGRFEYKGWFQGTARWTEGRIAPPAMAKVRSSVQRLSGLGPDCCYCDGWTDQSSVFVTFLEAGRTDVTTIDHYEGCEKAPDWLYDVENEIIDAFATERWLPNKLVVGKPPDLHRQ